MKIVLCLFLFNLIILHKILAKPVDNFEQKPFTASTDKTDSDVVTEFTTYDGYSYVVTSITPGNFLSTEAENTSIPSAIETTTTTTSENNTSDQATTVESITIDTNFTSIFDTIENDTLIVTTISMGTINEDENTTQFNITEEVTTLTPNQVTTSSPINLQVVISHSLLQVQYGQTYELICSVYGGDENTQIYWIQEEPERRYALTDTNDKDVTVSQVSLRSRITIDDRSKIGKYTCMAQHTNGNTASAILTMLENNDYYRPQPDVIPSTYFDMRPLSINVPDIDDGDFVEIQCVGAAPEDEAKIQWYFNNRLLNEEQPFYPRGKTLHIRPISSSYLGYYRCSIPDSHYVNAISTVTFRRQPTNDIHPVFSPSSPLTIDEGVNQLIQPSSEYYRVYWTRSDGQGLPSGIYQNGNDLQITGARSDHSGTYSCELYKADGTHINIPYEIHVRHNPIQHAPSSGGPPVISIHPQTIDLKYGQRLIIQYKIASSEPVQIVWTKYTDQGYQPIPSFFTIEPNRLILHRATPHAAGIYQITVRNSHGEARQELRVNVESGGHEHAGERHREHVGERHHEQEQVEVTLQPSEITVRSGETATITCHVKGAQQYKVTWSKNGHDTSLPHYAYQQGDSVIIAPTADTPSEQMYFQCQVDVPGQARPYIAYALITIRNGNEWSKRKRQVTRG